jgi:hypothetical protein
LWRRCVLAWRRLVIIPRWLRRRIGFAAVVARSRRGRGISLTRDIGDRVRSAGHVRLRLTMMGRRVESWELHRRRSRLVCLIQRFAPRRLDFSDFAHIRPQSLPHFCFTHVCSLAEIPHFSWGGIHMRRRRRGLWLWRMHRRRTRGLCLLRRILLWWRMHRHAGRRGRRGPAWWS